VFAWLTSIDTRLDRPGPHGHATDVTTLPGAARRFLAHPRPPVLLGTVGALAAVRAARGRLGPRDARVAGLCLLAQPFVEHAVHRWMLHAEPTTPLRRACYNYAGWGHAQHHADPTNLDTMFLVPSEVLRGGAVAAAVALAGPPAAATGALCVGLGTLAYDWSHFLIHSAYRPRTRVFQLVKRNHRLHHYRNERYWLGVTSPVADLVLRTSPARDDVPVSARAVPPRPDGPLRTTARPVSSTTTATAPGNCPAEAN
jgi:Fatty acid hydroxylase superfamily